MLSRKRPRVSSATGTWKPRKKARFTSRVTPSVGLRTGGWRGVPGRRGELKFVDVASNSTDFSATGVLVLLNGVAPGTGASQRIGKKLVMKSLYFRAAIGSGVTGANVFRGHVRLLFIYDKQTNATAPTVSDILQQPFGSAAMNMDNRDRFVVISDKQFAIDQAGGHQSASCKFFKKLNLQTIFNAGTAGTVADISTGSVYLLLISDDTGSIGSTNQPQISYYNRIRYDDS